MTAATAVLVLVVAVVALAETVYVSANSTMMFENKKRAKGEKRRRLYRGEPLKRLKKEGDWSLVKVEGQATASGGLREGYVRSADLTGRRPRSTMIRRRRRVSREAEDPIFTAGSRQLGPLGTKYAEENNLLKGKQIVEETMDYLTVPISDKISKEDLEKAKAAFYKKLEAFQEGGGVGDFAGAGEGEK
ncbi:MAG: hypothetical protein ACYTGB_14750 [Planctomycetota bacterium]